MNIIKNKVSEEPETLAFDHTSNAIDNGSMSIGAVGAESYIGAAGSLPLSSKKQISKRSFPFGISKKVSFPPQIALLAQIFTNDCNAMIDSCLLLLSIKSCVIKWYIPQ